MNTQQLAGECYTRLADVLETAGQEVWDRPSLCQGWRVREVVAHVTMPSRLTSEQFGAEMAAAHGDFQSLSDTVATRDSTLPITEHLANLRSTSLAAWQPPGRGAIGALNHAVVHSLDITNALNLPAPCSPEAARVILDSVTTDGVAAHFGIDLSDYQLRATDLDWTWGHGKPISGPSAELISLACHRTLSDGRTLA